MSILTMILELVAICLLLFGYVHEDKLIEWEQEHLFKHEGRDDS